MRLSILLLILVVIIIPNVDSWGRFRFRFRAPRIRLPRIRLPRVRLPRVRRLIRLVVHPISKVVKGAGSIVNKIAKQVGKAVKPVLQKVESEVKNLIKPIMEKFKPDKICKHYLQTLEAQIMTSNPKAAIAYHILKKHGNQAELIRNSAIMNIVNRIEGAKKDANKGCTDILNKVVDSVKRIGKRDVGNVIDDEYVMSDMLRVRREPTETMEKIEHTVMKDIKPALKALQMNLCRQQKRLDEQEEFEEENEGPVERDTDIDMAHDNIVVRGVMEVEDVMDMYDRQGRALEGLNEIVRDEKDLMEIHKILEDPARTGRFAGQLGQALCIDGEELVDAEDSGKKKLQIPSAA